MAATTMERLSFLRWLAEAGRLENAPAGPSSGPLAARVRTLPISTYLTEYQCSADHAVVRVNGAGSKAACLRGHRWLREGSGWRQVR